MVFIQLIVKLRLRYSIRLSDEIIPPGIVEKCLYLRTASILSAFSFSRFTSNVTSLLPNSLHADLAMMGVASMLFFASQFHKVGSLTW